MKNIGYENCKDSGIPWLGIIPSHWEIKPLWSMFKRLKRTGHQHERLLSVYRDYGVIPKDSRDDNANKASEDLSAYQLVTPGDLTINKMKAWQGSVAISNIRGIVSPAYFIFQPTHDAFPRYLHYLFRCASYIAGYLSISKGVRVGQWDMDPDHHSRMPVLIPPREEQIEIANYLDSETNRIGSLIEKKTSFIALLKEKKAALFSNILKNSEEVEFQQFPFWVIAKTKSISGLNEPLLSVYLDRGVIPYSEGGGLVHKPADSLEKYQLVEPNNLVLNNQQAWRGSLGVSEHRGLVSPAYWIFELDTTKVDPVYAGFMFRDKMYTDKFMLASLSVGDIQRQIKWHHLRKIQVALPSLETQRALARRLKFEYSKIEKLIEKTSRSIELLKEHQAAIITSAVTGKIDLRKYT